MKDWFKNHSRASASSGEGRRSLLDLRAKRHRKLSLLQAYSKLYYDSKVKLIVEERWKEEHVDYMRKNPNLTASARIPPLKFRNEVTQEMLDDESAEVKREVELEQRRSGQEESTEPAGANTPELDQNEDEIQRIKKMRQYQTYVYVVCPT